MINNLELIKPLLTFNSDDEFYFLQVLQRKKDHVKGKINGTNNNSRLIKAYYITSVENLEFFMDEIIALCDLFQARAGINLNKRSFKRTQMLTIRCILDQHINGNHHKTHKAYNTMCGKFTGKDDKIWIVDVDEDDGYDYEDHIEHINSISPVGDKIIARIPSRTGYHILTRPFNVKEYESSSVCAEVHKNNPTNLYIP